MDNETASRAQKAYAEARISGLTQKAAAAAAGYSPSTSPQQIERAGGPVHTLIIQALKEKGIDESFVAGEYRTGIAAATHAGAKELDLNAHAQYLKQLGYLLGYSKQIPQVAVQINNHAPEGFGDDPIRARELIEQVSSLVEVLEEAVGNDRAGGVHEGDPGSQDPPAREGVAGPPCDPEPACSGGGA